MKQVAQLLENIDDHASKLIKKSEVSAEAFIGSESSFPVPKDLSLVVSNVRLKDGKKGVIGIVGSKRMSYAKKLSSLNYLSNLISGVAVVIIIIKI